MKLLGKSWIRNCALGVLMLSICCMPSRAQSFRVRGRVALYVDDESSQKKDKSSVVVWLNPLEPQSVQQSWVKTAQKQHFAIAQRDHTFVPHILIVPVGAAIAFPNHDLIFHNVFSLFDGKRFDLGLYEADGSKAVKFDRPGVSYIFCNIHYEMSSVVVALTTPYYAVSDRGGGVEITGVPRGRYEMRVWAEGASVDTLNRLSRVISVEDDSSLGTLRIETMPAVKIDHQNKFGHDYDRTEQDPGYGGAGPR